MEAIYTHTVVKTLLSVVESWSNNLSQQSSHEQRGNRAHHKRLCIWMLSDGETDVSFSFLLCVQFFLHIVQLEVCDLVCWDTDFLNGLLYW